MSLYHYFLFTDICFRGCRHILSCFSLAGLPVELSSCTCSTEHGVWGGQVVMTIKECLQLLFLVSIRTVFIWCKLSRCMRDKELVFLLKVSSVIVWQDCFADSCLYRLGNLFGVNTVSYISGSHVGCECTDSFLFLALSFFCFRGCRHILSCFSLAGLPVELSSCTCSTEHGVWGGQVVMTIKECLQLLFLVSIRTVFIWCKLSRCMRDKELVFLLKVSSVIVWQDCFADSCLCRLGNLFGVNTVSYISGSHVGCECTDSFLFLALSFFCFRGCRHNLSCFSLAGLPVELGSCTCSTEHGVWGGQVVMTIKECLQLLFLVSIRTVFIWCKLSRCMRDKELVFLLKVSSVIVWQDCFADSCLCRLGNLFGVNTVSWISKIL
jgi:LPS sulfotransferase NodH